jgi:RNA polymerase sigma factor (TIGR02999 family)
MTRETRGTISAYSSMTRPADVTALLVAWGRGDKAAHEELIAVVYDELRRMARRRLKGEPADHSLAATVLVHETYLKLVDQKQVRWQNRAQFFALSARLMRRVLVDHARARKAAKRGGRERPVQLTDSGILLATARARVQPSDIDVLALDEALGRLKAVGPRHSALVELRFFGGLSIEEAADVLEVSPATVKRDWTLARAWLHRELARPVS